MSIEHPTRLESEALQNFYTSCRRLYSQGIVSKTCAQKSLEEVLCGFLGKHAWRPTHMSWSAAHEAISGNTRNIQRAHGVLDGRLERYDRTLRLLEGPEHPFETWWPFFREHDATVMITRTEHSTGVRFKAPEMIRLPVEDPDMFVTSGFSLRMRKGKEISWLRNLIPQGSVSNT
ncbi:MAG: hypothetical protein EBZ49_06105 [Proteobacteria bacterium]|nr:hypothetical protein [Pseudomonadota bacterium]